MHMRPRNTNGTNSDFKPVWAKFGNQAWRESVELVLVGNLELSIQLLYKLEIASFSKLT